MAGSWLTCFYLTAQLCVSTWASSWPDSWSRSSPCCSAGWAEQWWPVSDTLCPPRLHSSLQVAGDKKTKTKQNTHNFIVALFSSFFFKLKSWYSPCPSLWLMFLPSVCQKGADSGKRVWAAVWEEHTERLLWILHRWTEKKKRSTFENPSSIKLQGNVGNIQK